MIFTELVKKYGSVDLDPAHQSPGDVMESDFHYSLLRDSARISLLWNTLKN